MEGGNKSSRRNPSRRLTKSQHELSCINSFIQWHADTFRSQYRLIGQPDPPDAIIQTSRSTRWIEVADVPWSSAWAQDTYSFATPGEKHRPMTSTLRSGAYSSPDLIFGQNFARILKDKLEKKTYETTYKEFGAGYLILCILYPLFNDSTIDTMRREWNDFPCNNNGYFRSVFFTFPHLTKPRFRRWSI